MKVRTNESNTEEKRFFVESGYNKPIARCSTLDAVASAIAMAQKDGRIIEDEGALVHDLLYDFVCDVSCECFMSTPKATYIEVLDYLYDDDNWV